MENKLKTKDIIGVFKIYGSTNDKLFVIAVNLLDVNEYINCRNRMKKHGKAHDSIQH